MENAAKDPHFPQMGQDAHQPLLLQSSQLLVKTCSFQPHIPLMSLFLECY
jgi:hypothetical protein